MGRVGAVSPAQAERPPTWAGPGAGTLQGAQLRQGEGTIIHYNSITVIKLVARRGRGESCQ